MNKKQLNLSEYLEDFVLYKRSQGLSELSVKAYIFSIEKFIKYLGSNEPSKKQVESYIVSLSDISGEARKHYVRNIRVFLYWLMEDGIIDRFSIGLPRCQEPVPRIPTKEDIDKILRYKPVEFNNYRDWVIANLVISCGLRVRSIINLKTEDINLEEKYLVVKETKSKKSLTLPLTDYMVSILKKYLRTWDIGEWLFPNKNNTQLKVDSLKCSYRRLANKLGLSQGGLHSLRHYFATEATRQGMSPYVLQKCMQHSDISITMKYVNLVNDDIKNEMLKYNPLQQR